MRLQHTCMIFAAVVLITASISCKKFTKEELVTQLTEEYYNTDQCIE
ncbi:MAG: hypothetical protein H7Y42_04410, partial [Chitinophagaceae bacterium]|nr:hypothetical protein [Chitinophagaceae bacterium]